MPDAADWTCPQCGHRNNGHWLTCHNCGAHCACPTPSKSQFRSKAAATRWHRRAHIPGKAPLQPYRCPSGAHWHLTHGQPGWNDISLSIDAELEQIATRAAARYSDSLITAQGWTRTELVDAIHARLRTKYRQMRDTGQLERDTNGQIRTTQGANDA